MSVPCPHGMPTPASCWTCMEDGNLQPPPAPEPVTVHHVFTARFDGGQCRGCNLPISAGQRIAQMTDESYRHEGCA